MKYECSKCGIEVNFPDDLYENIEEQDKLVLQGYGIESKKSLSCHKDIKFIFHSFDVSCNSCHGIMTRDVLMEEEDWYPDTKQSTPQEAGIGLKKLFDVLSENKFLQ